MTLNFKKIVSGRFSGRGRFADNKKCSGMGNMLYCVLFLYAQSLALTLSAMISIPILMFSCVLLHNYTVILKSSMVPHIPKFSRTAQ